MELLKTIIPRYRNSGSLSEVFTENGDAIVSDVNPDVMNIVNTEGALLIREKTVSQGTVKISGEIQAQIFYQAYESQELFVTTAKLPFTHLCQAPCREGDLVAADLRLLSLQANLLNPRKVTCRAEIALGMELYRSEQFAYPETIRFEPEEKVQIKSRQVEEIVLIGVSQKKITAVDELRLSGSEMPDGSRILRWDVDWITEETKVLSKKIMVRGSTRIDLVALAPNGSYVTRSGYTAPFSQIVECEEVEPGDQVELRYLPLASLVRHITRPDGSVVLDYDLTVEITAMARRTVEYRVLEDAYSTAYQMEVEPCICRLENQVCPQTLETAVTEKLATDTPAVRVQDVTVRAASCAAECGDTAFHAEYYVKVLYETAEGLVCSACKRVPADFTVGERCGCTGVCRPFADGVSATVDQEGCITVSFRAGLTLTGTGGRDCSILADCTLNREKPRTYPRRGSLVLRNVGDGEDVWSIAKAYNTAPDEIRSANKLEQGEGLQPGRLLIIPFVG